MAATGIVEGLDVVEDSHTGFRVSAECVSVKELRLQGGKEARTLHCRNSRLPIPWKGECLPWSSVFQKQGKYTAIPGQNDG